MQAWDAVWSQPERAECEVSAVSQAARRGRLSRGPDLAQNPSVGFLRPPTLNWPPRVFRGHASSCTPGASVPVCPLRCSVILQPHGTFSLPQKSCWPVRVAVTREERSLSLCPPWSLCPTCITKPSPNPTSYHLPQRPVGQPLPWRSFSLHSPGKSTWVIMRLHSLREVSF